MVVVVDPPSRAFSSSSVQVKCVIRLELRGLLIFDLFSLTCSVSFRSYGLKRRILSLFLF